MKIFSWHTLKEKDEHGRYLGSEIFGEGGPFAFRKCYYFYKPNRKGRTSKKKAAASAANGKKGGRPRKKK